MEHYRFLTCIILSLFCILQPKWCYAENNPFEMDSSLICVRNILVERAFSTPDEIRLDNELPIDGLSVSGKIIQKSRNSFVRILIEDTKGNKYLVLESCKMYNDVDTFSFSNYCEESIYLNDIIPSKLLIFLNDASLELSSIHMRIGESVSSAKSSQERADRINQMSSSIRRVQAETVASKINEYNKKYNKLWRAEATDLAVLPWEDRRKVLNLGLSSNSQGFEYYTSGIFEMGEPTLSETRSVSPYIDSFDWRDRHGNRWLTPVRDQGTGNGCWAFAAIGVTEALVNLYYNKKIDYDLSEQEVISCSLQGSNQSGGDAASALGWIGLNGVSEEDSFPFSNSDEPCPNYISSNERISFYNNYYVLNHTINNNDSVKKYLIKYGPMVSGYEYFKDSLHAHSMALVGYATIHVGDTIRYFESYYQSPADTIVIHSGDLRVGKTYWIFKNSYKPFKYYDHDGYSYILFNEPYCFLACSYAKTPISSLIYDDSYIAITDADGDGYYYWGIGNRPSHCPSWVPSDPDGDDSDHTKGKMYLESPNIIGSLETLNPDGSSTLQITGNTTYSTRQSIYTHISITSNSKLTVQDVLNLLGRVTITIEAGGELVIDGGTITNADIVFESGGKLTITNGGQLIMRTNTVFSAPIGAIVDIESGKIIRSNDF